MAKSSATTVKRNKVDEKQLLVQKIIIPQCKQIFTDKKEEEVSYVFVSISNVIENCLLLIWKNYNKLSDKKSMTLYVLIMNISALKIFPKKFIPFFRKVRLRGNIQRHYVNTPDEIDLLIVRLEFYQFVNWFVTTYLKLPPIEIVENWYKTISVKNQKTSDVTIVTPVKKTKEKEVTKNDKEQEIKQYLLKIEYLEQTVDTLKKSEIDLVKKNSKEKESEFVKKYQSEIKHYKNVINELTKNEKRLLQEIVNLKRV